MFLWLSKALLNTISDAEARNLASAGKFADAAMIVKRVRSSRPGNIQIVNPEKSPRTDFKIFKGLTDSIIITLCSGEYLQALNAANDNLRWGAERFPKSTLRLNLARAVMAEAMSGLGRYSEAENSFKKVTDAVDATKRQVPFSEIARYLRAENLLICQDGSQALPQFELAEKAFESYPEEDRIMVLMARAGRAAAMSLMGNHFDAEEILLGVTDDMRESFGECRELKKVRTCLAQVWSRLDQHDDAVRLLEMLHATDARDGKPGNPDWISSGLELGTALLEAGRFEEAWKVTERLKSPIAKRYSHNHIFFGKADAIIAYARMEVLIAEHATEIPQKKLLKLIPILESSLGILNSSFAVRPDTDSTVKHPLIVRSEELLLSLLAATGTAGEVDQMSATVPDEDLSARQVEERIASLTRNGNSLMKSGKKNEATTYFRMVYELAVKHGTADIHRARVNLGLACLNQTNSADEAAQHMCLGLDGIAADEGAASDNALVAAEEVSFALFNMGGTAHLQKAVSIMNRAFEAIEIDRQKDPSYYKMLGENSYGKARILFQLEEYGEAADAAEQAQSFLVKGEALTPAKEKEIIGFVKKCHKHVIPDQDGHDGAEPEG
jgi:tetratricopeptide (TPR) repeat protein